MANDDAESAVLHYIAGNVVSTFQVERVVADPNVEYCWLVEGRIGPNPTRLLVYLAGHPLGPDHEEVE